MSRDPKHDVLFEPVKIGPRRTRNRFWQTSHCAGPGSERPGAQAHLRGMKAEGGWGVVFTEFCSIHQEADEYPYTSARIWDEGDVRNLGYMCDVAHSHGSLAGIQLWYSGGNAPSLESREIGRSPSQWLSPLFATRSVYGYEMDESDIRSVINMYVEAGKRAAAAGFDILEVSAGDDTVPIQFLEPRFNRRTDRYGGSFENRSRFFIELLHALKRALGDRCAITTRFEMDTLHGPEGVEAHEDGVRLLELFRREGAVDAVALKIGDYAEWGEDAGTSRFRKSGWMTPFIKQGKSILGDGIPVVGNGRLTSPDDMVALLRAGVLDIIGAARPSIADPFLPTKISEGRLSDIRECIGCNICVSKFQQGGQIMCTQNVTIGEEYRRGWHPEKFVKTSKPCSVLVVGGGPAGMECARILGERGYTVHLREAEQELGGHWKSIATLPRLSEWGRVITYRQAQLAKLRKTVDVHLGVGRMSAGDVLQYGADRVVIATGSHWCADGRGANYGPIAGADASLPHILTPAQVMQGKPVVGHRVMVLDGDGHFMGLALAELMANQGKQVTYVCDAADVSEYGVFTMESGNNKRMMFEKRIKSYCNHWVDRIEPGCVRLSYLYKFGPDLIGPSAGSVPRKDNGGEFELPIDAVILVTSRYSDTRLWHELKAREAEWAANGIEDVFRIGDCKAPAQLNQALWDAHRLAREFDSPHPAYPLPWIRERQLWGGPTVPALGDPRIDVEAG
ncbi:MAG TPA: FAD-dependent oxidoreductase [Steroidobacteraceae bacterium]|nr:FAD-dependent oxidoreductase [Steroidobacteraceae bacterium]